MKKIADLKIGDVVKLSSFGQANPVYRKMLLSLGLTLGVEVKVLHIAPLGCPVEIEARGVAIALRKNEAMDLVWV